MVTCFTVQLKPKACPWRWPYLLDSAQTLCPEVSGFDTFTLSGRLYGLLLDLTAAPMSVTAVFAGFGPLKNPSEGVMGRLRAGTYHTLREESCARLFNIVQECGCVLIKAPPCTGKTSQLQLLMRWLEGRGVRVAYITFLTLRPEHNVLDFVARHVDCDWEEIEAGATGLVCRHKHLEAALPCFLWHCDSGIVLGQQAVQLAMLCNRAMETLK